MLTLLGLALALGGPPDPARTAPTIYQASTMQTSAMPSGMLRARSCPF